MDDLRWLLPDAADPVHEALAVHQLTHEFHDEVRYRDEFEQYCAWYTAVAIANQREHQKMQADFNVLGWFYRGSSNHG